MTTSNLNRESAAVLRSRQARWKPLEYAAVGFFLAAIALLFVRNYLPRDPFFAQNNSVGFPFFAWSSSHGLHVDYAVSAFVVVGAALGCLLGIGRARTLRGDKMPNQH
jgi:uncharacterized integral membrane protein